MKQEHKDLILESLRVKNELLQKQSEVLQAQGKMIEDQDKVIKQIMETLTYATETNRLQSHKIAELMVDHQLVTLMKPVNSWSN
jgi:hypothetical protein